VQVGMCTICCAVVVPPGAKSRNTPPLSISALHILRGPSAASGRAFPPVRWRLIGSFYTADKPAPEGDDAHDDAVHHGAAGAQAVAAAARIVVVIIFCCHE